MEEQAWRRQTRRHSSLRSEPRSTTISSHSPASIRPATVTSSKTPEPSWKSMRQSVRIKATMDTEKARSRKDARIADLCEEDREKVAKLIRRIVEIGALNEAKELEFAQQQTVLETQVVELREQVKRDAIEIEELSGKLKQALSAVQDYQERVLMLEESNEAETQYRLGTDQTMDLLKLEVDKLRKLVMKQKQEMEEREDVQHQKHKQEMECMGNELKQVQDQLLEEQKARLQEKQQALEHRLKCVETSPQVSVHSPIDSPRRDVNVTISSLLNTSVELPEKLKDIMNEWKQRMEEALNTVADNQTCTQEQRTPQTAKARGVTIACQTEVNDSGDDQDTTELRTPQDRKKMQQRRHSIPRVRRKQFDKYLTLDSDDNGNDDVEEVDYADTKTPIMTPRHCRQVLSNNIRKSITRTLVDEFDGSDQDPLDEDLRLAMAMMNEQDARSNIIRQPLRSHPNHLSAYEASLLDVVDAVESTGTLRLRDEPSPMTRRIDSLLHSVEAREAKLSSTFHTRHMSEPIVDSDLVAVLNDPTSDNDIAGTFSLPQEPRTRPNGLYPR